MKICIIIIYEIFNNKKNLEIDLKLLKNVSLELTGVLNPFNSYFKWSLNV